MNSAESPLRRPSDLLPVRVFLVALAGLLAGYMFLGRGFAHVGVRPIFVGEVVLVIGLIATAYAIVRLRPRPNLSPIVWLLIAFIVLGAARTIPFLGAYGVDALRDGVLWGYAVFALMIYVLADRQLLLDALRAYGWVVPVFALWVPVFSYLFGAIVGDVPLGTGENVPFLFFKNTDIAVHTVGAIAFLVVGTNLFTTARQFAWRTLVAVPLMWAIYLTGSISRGAMAAVAAGLGVAFLLAPRSRNWAPVFAGVLVLVIVLATPGFLTGLLQPGLSPEPTPTVSVAPPSAATPSAKPSPSAKPTPSASPKPSPTREPVATPAPTPEPPGRAIGLTQWFENLASVLFKSSDENLEGTKRFRLAWWTKIVDYTVFGPYFWTGKGFGVNLGVDDGFQPEDNTILIRAPHNSHITTLARMGVPGFVLWVVLQGAFVIGLARSTLAHRRNNDAKLAAVGAMILVYWAAMSVNTSFDPYLEGPHGGIWFWTLFGLGLVVMRLSPPPTST